MVVISLCSKLFMDNATLTALLSKREALEAALGRIEMWALIFGVIVVIGVAGESIFGVRTWRNNRKLRDLQQQIEQIQQTETTQLNNEAEDARSTARKADERAAKAELELEKLRTPRTIDDETFNRLVKRFRPFSGQNFDIDAFRDDKESTDFATRIFNALQLAGWSLAKNSSGTLGFVVVVGVEFCVRPDADSRTKMIANESASIFRSEGISATDLVFPPSNDFGILTTDMILVRVGKKP